MRAAAAVLLLLIPHATTPATGVPPYPGKLIDLGGRRLHLNCQGSGSPTVIVENGGGGFSVEWAPVQPEIAETTQICTYDRAGYAWSDSGPLLDGIEQIVDDLNLLTRKAGLKPPYILLGASLGCIYARAFQRRFPERVAGLVFVDGTHDEGVSLILDGKPTPISLLPAEQLEKAFDEYHRIAPKPMAGPADTEPLNRLPPSLRQARHWALEKLIAEAGLLPNTRAAAESWRQEFAALRKQRQSSPHSLGTLPLVVLERSQAADDAFHQKQQQLAALSSGGKLIRAESSGHAIHLYRPDLVIEAIKTVQLLTRKAP